MTIYLPENTTLFRAALDETCDRILHCEQDIAFYDLLLQLVVNLTSHPLLKEYFLALEADSEKQKSDLMSAALSTIEEEWKIFWKLHSGQSFKRRRLLAGIKRIVTTPREISYLPLYQRILFNMREFCYLFPPNAFSQKYQQMEKRLFLPGKDDHEKRRNMQITAETNPLFCWGRFRFLEQIYRMEKGFAPLKASKGRWPIIRETAWQSALNRCEREALLGAKMLFEQKLSSEPTFFFAPFLLVDYQIHRQDFEKYLLSLKNHIRAYLFKIENQKKDVEDPRLILPGSKKEDFVVQPAHQYWKLHPLAKRDEVFDDYCLKCPPSRILSRERWEQIIRKCKLDPRPKEARKRGPGKKT